MHYIKARQWIRATFAQGSRPTMRQVAHWIELGDVVGKWREGELLIDPLATDLRGEQKVEPGYQLEAEMHPLLQTEKPTGFVYLIFVPEAGRLKIGFSTQVQRRVMQLQGGSPLKLTLLKAVPGTEKLERRLLFKYRHKRIHGEWFEDCPEIRAEFRCS